MERTPRRGVYTLQTFVNGGDRNNELYGNLRKAKEGADLHIIQCIEDNCGGSAQVWSMAVDEDGKLICNGQLYSTDVHSQFGPGGCSYSREEKVGQKRKNKIWKK